MDEREPEDYILCEFSGEGSTSIVFGVTPRSAPQDPQWVMKFLKPDVRFELTVLHHSFEIAEELYPDHPLLMAPEERMRRLGDEMLSRIESPGVLFRIAAYRDLLASTLGLLAGQFSQSFKPDTSPRDLMRELGPVVPMIDDNLIRQIESNLEDDAFVDDLQPFFEQCLDSLQAMITAARQDGVYRPFSQNVLLIFWGCTWRISSIGRVVSISGSPQFQSSRSMQDVEDFRLWFRLFVFELGRKERMKRDPGGPAFQKQIRRSSKPRCRQRKQRHATLTRSQWEGHHSNIFRDMPGTGSPRGSCLRTNPEAIQAFEQALDVSHRPIRWLKADIDLSSLLEDSEPKKAATYASEAMEIRRRLEEG